MAQYQFLFLIFVAVLGHTRSKVWQDLSIASSREAHKEGLSTGLKGPSGKGKRLIIVHIDIKSCHCESPSSSNPMAVQSTLPSLVKEVEDNSRYKTLEANATLLKLLVDDKDGVSRSEVFDMLHSHDDNEDHIDLPTFPDDTEDGRAEVPLAPDSQAEFLQAAGDSVRRDQRRYANARGEPIGAAAGIMVVVTCSIVCLAYTALIVWRRIYLKRNGLKHELLRNEESIAETRIEL